MLNSILNARLTACFAASTCIALMCGPGLSQAAEMYQLEGSITIPSAGEPRWDYIDFDATTNQLFIGMRDDGMKVVDVTGKKPVRTVENSKGAGGVVVASDVDRGYSVNQDGTVTIFELSSLKVLDHPKIEEGTLNSGFYEPFTKKVVILTGDRPETSAFISLDPKTGKVLGRTDFKSKKLDTPMADGAGLIYVPDRANGTIIKIDAKDMKTLETWPAGDCAQPIGLDIDKANKRILVSCRTKPIFIAMDANTGKIVSTLPIGRNTDGLIFDHDTKLAVSSNGDDANLSVIRQKSADEYEVIETTGSRPMARTMAYDPKTKKVYVITAGFSFLTVPGKKEPTRIFHKDSFTLLTYVRK
jgi:DNA-binding beta-propeller fold protein YncE